MTLHTYASISLLLLTSTVAAKDDAAYVDLEQQNVITFIEEMVEQHDFDAATMHAVLGNARIKSSIIRKISTPSERRLTWAEYRKIFITEERISAGVDFWRDNEAMLKRIELESGVPVSMLVGIIGVETYFGRITGKDRVIDALATLAFGYPPRAKFFRKELVQFLLLTREEDVDPGAPTGSYAGAMGRPQFMPSSFRAYAVDATGDGKRDIWNNWADSAGSIANYFNAHGWKNGGEIVAQATLGHNWKGATPKPKNSLRSQHTVASLSDMGILFATELAPSSDGQLLTYEGPQGLEHWVGFHNFFVITKYNHSAMYALAVHQLGQKISSQVQADAS
jgi:membrane-bound lytic murein transglycosylase B